MKIAFNVMAVVFVATAFSGCTQYREYQVNVTSYLSRAHALPTDGARVHLRVQTDLKEPLLEMEVAAKVRALVIREGFEVADQCESDYVLRTFFTIDNGHTETGVRPVYSPGGTSYSTVHTGSGQYATVTTQNPGTTTYVPYAETYFVRYLKMELYKKDQLEACLAAQKDEKEKDLSSAIVWSSTTTSAGSSSDLRSVIDYLLVVTFDYFGRDTGQRKSLSIYENDKRVSAMRQTVAENGQP